MESPVGFEDVFSDRPGKISLVYHEVVTAEGRPVRQNTNRLPHSLQQVVKDELQLMEEDGIIIPYKGFSSGTGNEE